MNVQFIYDRILGNGDFQYFNNGKPYARYKEFRRKFNRIVNKQEFLPASLQLVNGSYGKINVQECIFRSLDILCDTYGVETLYPIDTKNGQYIDYLNTGDPYKPTIVYCKAWKYPFRIAYDGWSQYVK